MLPHSTLKNSEEHDLGDVNVDSMTGMQTPLQFEICMSGHQQICICKYFLPPSAGPHHLTTLLEIIVAEDCSMFPIF